MSNTLIIDSLNTLFSMSNTAVLGAQEQFVAFMNPAAQELFRGDRTNHKLSELLVRFGCSRSCRRMKTPCGPARSLRRFWRLSTLFARSRRISRTTPCSSVTYASGAMPPS